MLFQFKLAIMTEIRNLNHSKNSREDISSFEELFRSYYPQMKRYTLHFVPNEEEANDLIQDVFLKLWSERSSLDGKKNEVAFMFTLLRNKCLNLIKKKVIEGKYMERQIFMETERLYYLSFDQIDEFESMKDRLSLEFDSLIKEMPDKCGIVFRLRWLEGKKIKEIAAQMNISTTMVDKQLAKGMEIARRKFKNEFLFLFSMLTVD